MPILPVGPTRDEDLPVVVPPLAPPVLYGGRGITGGPIEYRVLRDPRWSVTHLFRMRSEANRRHRGTGKLRTECDSLLKVDGAVSVETWSRQAQPLCFHCFPSVSARNLQAETRRRLREPQARVQGPTFFVEHVVYYLLVGPNVVKIGRTKDLHARMGQLFGTRYAAEHGVTVLALEPDDGTTERRRHVQFKGTWRGASLGRSRELFDVSPELGAHIFDTCTEWHRLRLHHYRGCAPIDPDQVANELV